MAFSVTARHSGNSLEDYVQTVTTDSQTPTADSLLLLFSSAQNGNHTTTQNPQTPTGGGWTYTQVALTAQVAWDGSDEFASRGVAYRAPVDGSPSAHTITVDHYTGTQTGAYGVVACDVTGHNAGSPVAQSATNAESQTAGDNNSGSVTLGSTPAVDNLVVVYFSSGANDGGFTTPTFGGQSMTALFNTDAGWTQTGLWYRVVTGTESTNTINLADLGQNVGQYNAIAVEIAAEGGAAEQDITPAAQTVDATPGTMTVTTGSVGITPAAQTINATPGTLSLSVGIVPGAVTVDATPGTLTVAPGPVDITPDPVTVTATPGTVTVSSGVTDITPGAVTIDVTPGTTTLTAGVVDITPDAVTIDATPGGLTLDLDVALAGPMVEATPGTLTVAAGTTDVTPAAVTVGVTPGTVTISGGGIADPNPFKLSHTEPAGITHQEAFAITFREPA